MLDLDKYEKDIESHFKEQESEKDNILLEQITSASKFHIKNTKSITIRVPVRDLEIIKLKASKAGLPYQTYINMLIHESASTL